MKTAKLISILTLCIALYSCVKDKYEINGIAPEGEPTLVDLTINAATMNNGNPNTTKATYEEESKIEDIRIMIFNKNGSLVTNIKHTNLNNQTKFTIKTYSGNNCTIYMIANAVEAIDRRLQIIHTLKEAQDASLSNEELGFGLQGKPLLMTGILPNVNIQAGDFTIVAPIELTFMTSKLTLNVIDATAPDEEVTILNWQVVDAPINTYVFPHLENGNPKDITPAPVAADSDPDRWFTSGIYTFRSLNRADIPSSEYTIPSTFKEAATTTLYLIENRRGGRRERDINEAPEDITDLPDPEGAYRGNEGKRFYSPFRSTHVVINAMHKKSNLFYQIKAYIFIGANAINDYNVKRGDHYTFYVTVLGLNNIKIDSNVIPTTDKVKIEHAESLVMDSHPDFRPFHIYAPKGKMSVEILDETGTAISDGTKTDTDLKREFWLKISPLNLMNHQVKQSPENAVTDPGFWQENGIIAGNFARARYIPHKSVRLDLEKNHQADIPLWWQSYGIINDDYDSTMKLPEATFRMCYTITEIMFTENQVTDKMLFLYADENITNTGRSAKLKFTFWSEGNTIDGNPDYQIIKDISQDSYRTIYEDGQAGALSVLNEDGTITDNKRFFVVESNEEVSMEINPGIDPSVQHTEYMQWGFEKETHYGGADRNRNGEFLTLNSVYQTDGIVRSGGLVVSYKNNYQSIYGNGLKNNTAPMEFPYKGGNSGAPYYYNTASYAHPAYHPIFNSSAARYCHEKNRDKNGDGKISLSEAKWHLPARDQLLLIWVAGNTVGFETVDQWFGVNYWSSTEADERVDEKGVTHFEKAAMNFGNSYSPITDNGGFRVRCIRNL